MGNQKASGKFVVRIPSELHLDLKRQADLAGSSLNQICLHKFSDGFGQNLVVETATRFFGKDLLGIYQFGSTVRNEDTENSDVDILIVLASDFEIDRSTYRKWDQFVPDGSTLSRHSFHFVHLLQNIDQAGALWLELALEGFPLFDPKFRIHNELIQIRMLMVQNKVKRTYSHGHPVWSHVAKEIGNEK